MSKNDKELKPVFPLVILDFDGTIIDSQPSILLALEKTLTFFNLVANPEEIKKASFLGIRDLVTEMTSNTALSAEEFNRKFKEIFLGIIPTGSTLFPGMFELLAKLHQVCCVVLLTNKSRIFGIPTLKTLGIDKFFHGTFFHEDFTDPKPSPVPVNAIIEQFGFSKNQTIVIGDTTKDLLAAKNALVSSCYVSYGYGHYHLSEIEEIGYTYEAKSVSDIAAIFQV